MNEYNENNQFEQENTAASAPAEDTAPSAPPQPENGGSGSFNDNSNNDNDNTVVIEPEQIKFEGTGSRHFEVYGTKPKAKKKSHSFGKVLLSGILIVALMAATSVSSIMGYTWYMDKMGKNDHSGDVVEGGQRVVYTLAAEEGSLTPQEIFVKCSPSAVSIVSYVQSRYGTSESTGTGIIMSEDGYIITNHHVIDGATAVYVAINGEEYQATIVGSEAKSDIAVLKVDAQGLEKAEFGVSSDIVTGDSAIVIGNPLGTTFADTMTIGYISATQREVQIEDYIMSLIQIDAAVNPGNSGGPLINSRGQVIGVVNAKISQEDVEGIGFAIPIDTALKIANDLIDHGYVTDRPMLGITIQSLPEEYAAYYGYEAGITVTEILPDSCAEQGGMQVGDKIIAFNGIEVENSTELNYQKDKCSVGDTVTITVERDGQTIDLTIVLAAGTAA